jgi:hypothetical protein
MQCPESSKEGYYYHSSSLSLSLSLFISCCSHLEHRASMKRFIWHQFLRQSVGLFGRGGSARPKAATCTGQRKHRINEDIHALSGIRTHDPSVRASEDISCLRPCGHCDRRIIIHYLWKISYLMWFGTLGLPTLTRWIPWNAFCVDDKVTRTPVKKFHPFRRDINYGTYTGACTCWASDSPW